MKKLSLLKISLCVFLAVIFAGVANAKDGVYVGIDANVSKVKHRYKDPSGAWYGPEERRVDATNVGIGLDLGYKASFDSAFVAPEIFYDYLNNSSKDFYYTDSSGLYKQDSMEVNSRYGVKINLGYNLTKNLNGFINAGLTNVEYSVKWPSTMGVSYGGTKKFVPLYGFGFSYDLTDDWALRASYDFQQFYGRYLNSSSKDKISLHVVKAGVVYSF